LTRIGAGPSWIALKNGVVGDGRDRTVVEADLEGGASHSDAEL